MCEKTKEDDKFSAMTLRSKVKFVFDHMTVEPVVACFIIPSVLLKLANQNLNLEKACRVNLKYSDEVCDALTARQTKNYTREETEVQQLVAGMAIWMTFIQSAIPGFLIMFLGSWSDRKRRRKPFMLMPLIGDILACLSNIVCVYFFYELPMEVTGLFECIFPALTGGWMTMIMSVFSYIGDITTVEDRTVRIGITNVFISAGFPIGMSLSGVLFKKIGFYGIYLTSFLLYNVGFWWILLKVKEPNKIPKEKLKTNLNPGTKKQTVNIIKTLKDLFELTHIKETFVTVLKSGDKKRQKKVALLFVVLIVVIGPMFGEMTVLYLFMRYRFNWDEVQFSIFSTYSVITHLIGTSFSVGVFSHLLKIDDALIGVMSCISKILAGFVYAFARTEWQVYLAPLVDIVNGTSFIAMRSIASKLVPPEELGKLNSLYGACEALTPLLYGPMYAFVYSHTMDTMPGAFFLLGGALTMPAVVIFGWMYTQHRGDRLQNAMSRKSSMAEDVIRNLRVESLAVTPSFQTSDTDPALHAEDHGGEVNMAFQDHKS